MPRKDLKVTKDGVAIAPGLALGSWAAFKKMGNETMVMGGLVLTEDEIEPVMLKLQQEGIEQTALHNHLLGETPRIMYMRPPSTSSRQQPHLYFMHFWANDDATKLAQGLRAALDQTNSVKAATK